MFVDSFLVRPAGELLGPRWAKEKRNGPLWLVLPRWVESPDSLGEGEPSAEIFWDERIGTAGACPTT